MNEKTLEGVTGAQAELAALRARAAVLEAQLRAQGQAGGLAKVEAGEVASEREAVPTSVPVPEISREAAHSAVAEVWVQKAVEGEGLRKESDLGVTPHPSPLPVRGEGANHLGSEGHPSSVPTHPEAITLKLSPERHDAKMGELIGMLQERGVAAAIAAAEATGSPHLIDDFHRVLVEYVREGLPIKVLPKEKTPLAQALGLVLLKISLPAPADKKDAGRDRAKDIRDFIGLMEQFYRGAMALDRTTPFALEIANAVGAHVTSAFLAVPAARREAFEKQLTAVFPNARIAVAPDDYNIFADSTAVVAAEARLAERPIFGLREEVAGDPMDAVLSALSKLDAMTEGAALQVIIRGTDGKLSARFRRALERIRTGTPIREASKAPGLVGEMMHDMFKMFAGTHKTPEQLQQQMAGKQINDDPRVKAIERKIANPLLETVIRIVASAPAIDRAQVILSGIEAAFEQLSDTAGGNRLTFRQVPTRRLKTFEHAFSYRLFDPSTAVPLTSLELSLMAHLPRPESIEAAPELMQEKNASAPAPLDLPQQGTLLGINRFRGIETKAYVLPEDRLRHMYLIGQTGTGKSALLKNIVMQDILSGAGACFIDPHGTDVMDILSAIPKERAHDVIYFDPGDTSRPMGLNMLEYDPAHPEQKTLIVDELLGIFNKLFDMKVAGGPAFEQYFRNAALLVMDDPESGNSLLDISRIFSDEDFRAMKLSRCKNAQVVQFWRGMAEKTTGEQGLQNFGPYITNKFDVFTTNEIMRPIIAQQHSAFNIRKVMDERKILLVNLSKGRIGDINANLLGLIIVGKFLLAALSRADSFGQDLPPFYLAIDEFQNFTTPSIATILSEARKYKLSLTVAHQFIAQLSEDIRNAVFGNVGSVVSFRVGVADTEILEKQFAPVFSAADLIRVDNYRAFVRILSHGQPTKPFNIETLPPPHGTPERLEALRDLSSLTYGRPREEVEAEIANTTRGW